MNPELPEPNYYDKFLGVELGKYCASNLRMWHNMTHNRPETSEHSSEWIILDMFHGQGLMCSYSPFYKKSLLEYYYKSIHTPGMETLQLQAGLLLAVAVRLMVSNEIMLEDLMSAVIDYLPPGLLVDNPNRAKLLAAQDYLEERQTLVNNIIAGDLEGIDLDEIDQRNIARCEVSDDLSGALAAGFYIVAARKNDFNTAMKLALEAKWNKIVTLVVGVIAGACYGTSIIPKEYQEDGGIPPRVEENAKEMHWTVLMFLDPKKYFDLKPDSVTVFGFNSVHEIKTYPE